MGGSFGGMAAPLPTKKTTVDLGKGGVRRVSRIRREPPPPPAKPLTQAEIRQREAWTIAIGITAIALALFVVSFSLGKLSRWEPQPITIVMD